MSQPIEIDVSDEAYAELRRQAEAAGLSPAAVASLVVEQRFARRQAAGLGVAGRRLEDYFGSIPGPVPGGTDNEAIDEDLAREYANHHEHD